MTAQPNAMITEACSDMQINVLAEFSSLIYHTDDTFFLAFFTVTKFHPVLFASMYYMQVFTLHSLWSAV